jgi:hypothetical protein
MPILKGSRPLPKQPKIDLEDAQLQVLEVVVNEEPQEKTKKDGEGTFTIDPHVQLKLMVLTEGDHEGEEFHDRFSLKETDGVWTVRGGTKLGKLFELAHDDPNYFDRDDIEIDPDDLKDLEFVAHVKPGENYGSYVDFESIKAVGDGDGDDG